MKDDTIKESNDWRTKGYDKFMSKEPEGGPKPAEFIGGADFDALLDDLAFNRVIILKDLREKPQGNTPGKIYWDGDNNKFKMWYNDSVGWVDIVYTSTSTSTSTTSSSSTSTTTTSSSSSTTSTSSSSTSTTTT